MIAPEAEVEPGPGAPGIISTRWLLWAAALLVPLYLWAGLGNRDVWAPDEPRFALVAREMQMRGNYALPTVNGEPYAHKPPLLFWMISLASVVTGKDAADGLTARIPSALAGAGTLATTSVMGARLFGPQVALLAPLVLATTHLFCQEAHAARMDALLTFWVSLAMMFLVLHRDEGRLRYALGFQLACSMGLLTKGVGVIFPWAVAWLWPRGKADQGRPSQLFRPLPLLVLALPVAAWLAAATVSGGREYVETLLGKHVVKRYFDSLGDHNHPFWYFFADTPKQMAPWTGLLPAMILFARATWRDRGVRFAVTWIACMLLFFSYPPGKRGVYMLPAFPAIALLAASALEAVAAGHERIRKVALPGLALVAVLFVAVLGVMTRGTEKLLGMQIDTVWMQLALGFGVVAMGAGVWYWTVRALARAVVVSTAAVFLVFYASVLGQLDPVKSSRAFCRQGVLLRNPGEPLGYFGDYLEQYTLFSGENLLLGKKSGEFAEHFRKHPSVLTFMQKEYLAELRATSRLSATVLVEKRLGDKNMVIARVTRPASE